MVGAALAHDSEVNSLAQRERGRGKRARHVPYHPRKLQWRLEAEDWRRRG
jgi:hypothetical protein